LGIESRRIEKDLRRILEYLEEERDKRLSPVDEDKEYALTKEEKALGVEFLKSPDLFDQVVKDMDTIGYVGEILNKQLMYIAASSRKLDDPISVLVVSESASGKSMLVDTVKKLIPAEDVISVTSLSDQALNYVGDLSHKFMTLGEALHGDIVDLQLREMLSSKELSRMVTMKDSKSGVRESKIIRTKAIVSCVMSTTDYNINPENASRSFIIDTDESREQTQRIHEAQRAKYTLERYKEMTSVIPGIIKKHHSAQRLLKKIVIVNRFAYYLRFPDKLMRTRRDHDRFLDLIAGVCFIRQYQKETKNNEGIPYIECDLDDYKIAYTIMVNGVLSATMLDLPKGAISLYEDIREMVREMAKERKIETREVTFIQKEVRAHTGLGGELIKKHIRTLVDYEYIQVTNGKNRGTRRSYRIRSDEPIDRVDFDMIPAPVEMGEMIKKELPN
ncbi:MAG: hypothetical protein GY754_15770, partial [bacterium]|nr:hypothetical protein [bacterium]